MNDTMNKTEMVVKEFSTVLKQHPVKVDGKLYAIRELTGAVLGQYRRSMGGEIGVGRDGKTSLVGMHLDDVEVRLLSLCMYDEDDRVVPTPTLKGWPSTVLEGLFTIAQNLSGLDKDSRDKQREEAKND